VVLGWSNPLKKWSNQSKKWSKPSKRWSNPSKKTLVPFANHVSLVVGLRFLAIFYFSILASENFAMN
jgi:hypothetical protein